MAKYRKKPVVIEAEQFLPEEGIIPRGVSWRKDGDPEYFVTTIHEAKAPIVSGDWIIPEPKPKFGPPRYYPCKADIFEATYEKVED
jgi:hypothetical protein